MSVVDWFYDPAVSGADPIETRPGFAALRDRIEGNGVRVVLTTRESLLPFDCPRIVTALIGAITDARTVAPRRLRHSYTLKPNSER
jgi:hypothetical protein